MSDVLARLEPRPVWDHFAKLAAIPRPSKHEERAAAYVESIATRIGVSSRRDATGNVVIPVPASPGREKAPIVILQGHLDMVGEKNGDSGHDFTKDPILPRLDGEWVRATGTTLGADNGIGVAAALAAATDPNVVHGPLELLFTLDEETGLTGASNLDPSILRGRILLNLDSEEDGVIFVGCAGGCDTLIDFEPTWRAPSRGTVPLALEIKGLRGGHSGLNIVENRGNALKLLARVLGAALEDGIDIELAYVRGGSKHNAIPREADALVHVAADRREAFEKTAACMKEGFGLELSGIDDGLTVSVTSATTADRVVTPEDRDRLLRCLMALPHGVLAMSRDIPGLVETSSNLAVVRPENGLFHVVTSSRSSVAPSLRMVLASIRSTAFLAGGRAQTQDGYPGWKPNLGSPALKVVREVYRDVWGQDPKVTAIHAGLECGLLGEKVPGLDMVSFGPQIEGAHSPEERVHVASVGRFWDALRAVLDRLSR